MNRERHKTKYPGIWYRESASGRRYIVWYSDANGDPHTETLPAGAGIEDAQIRKAQLQVRRAMGDTLIPTRLTVGELLDLWLERREHDLNPKTVRDYTWAIEKHLRPTIGTMRVRGLSGSEVARLISNLKRDGMKTWSVRKVLTPLQGAYKMAEREGWVASSPVNKLLPHERPKGDQRKMRCLGRDQIPALLKAASSDRWRLLFSLLVFTGLRIGEALNLEWRDIDIPGRTLRVRVSKTKAGERDVFLMPSLASALGAHKLSQPPGTEVVFANANGTRVSRRECLRALRAAEKRAKLPDYTLHELRHTFASILISQGGLPTFVASQMGHADPSVTMSTYAHLFEGRESVDLARDRLQESFGGML